MTREILQGLSEADQVVVYKAAVLYAVKKLRHPKYSLIQRTETIKMDPVELVNQAFVALHSGQRKWNKLKHSLEKYFTDTVDSYISHHLELQAVRHVLEKNRLPDNYNAGEQHDAPGYGDGDSHCPSESHQAFEVIELFKQKLNDRPDLSPALKIINSDSPGIDFRSVSQAFGLVLTAEQNRA